MYLARACMYLAIRGLHDLIVHRLFFLLIIIVGSLMTAGLFLFNLISLWHNRIIFHDDKIVITGHWIIKKQGLQFPDEIEYSEIKDIAIICANANSLKKRITSSGYSSLRPFIYYEITLKNNDTKWVYIECFSRNQRKRMLDIVNDKAGLNLSYKLLERKDYSIYKRKKNK